MFKILNKKEVYQNKWIKLSEWETEYKQKKGVYSVINRSNTAIVIPLTESNNTILRLCCANMI